MTPETLDRAATYFALVFFGAWLQSWIGGSATLVTFGLAFFAALVLWLALQ